MFNCGVDGPDSPMPRMGSRPGATFERRLQHLGIEQVRTPFRAARANAISGSWMNRSALSASTTANITLMGVRL
jgi:hypothetical protein